MLLQYTPFHFNVGNPTCFDDNDDDAGDGGNNGDYYWVY